MGKCPRSPPTLVKHALTLQNDFSLSTITWQLTPTNTWREKELGRYPPFPLSKTPTKSRFLRASLIILTTLIICVFLYSNLHDGGRVIIVQGRRLALSKELSSTVGQHRAAKWTCLQNIWHFATLSLPARNWHHHRHHHWQTKAFHIDVF